jgi:hypothetical protein
MDLKKLVQGQLKSLLQLWTIHAARVDDSDTGEGDNKEKEVHFFV